MLTQIPTHVICGPLGAGKTSLIRSLLAQKPASERWAVLINEFGQIGLDAALLSTAEAGISLAEVSGGCLCCVNGVPFQVGLSRLLRKAKPDRLLIEPSGLGHPTELLTQLSAPPWQDALALQPCLAVLDAAALARDEPLPRSVQQAIQRSGLLLLNKSEALDQADRQRIMAGLPSLPLLWTTQGELPITALPGIDQRAGPRADSPLPLSAPAAPVGDIWLNPQQPVCQSQASADGWSIGWRWHSSQRFDLQRIERWLGSLDWRRAKMVLHSPDGWRSANALAGERLLFKPSEWRKDSRLELIFNGPADEALLKAAMAACRL